MKSAKKLLAAAVSISMIFSVFSPIGEAAKKYFSRPGITNDDSSSTFMEKCIVMRIGNCEGYIGNQRTYIYEGNHEVRPFINGETMYVPVRFILDGLKAAYTADGNRIEFSYGGSEKTLSENDAYSCMMSNGQLFVSVDEAARIFSLSVYEEDGLVFLSGEKNIFENGIDEKTFKSVKNMLEYEWLYMNMGSALGYVTGVYAHPKNPDIMYATGDVSPMFRYDKESESWYDCNRGIFENANCNFANSMGSIALDPNNENIVYAVFGNDSVNRGSEGTGIDIFKSADYGKSWTRTFFGKSMCAYSGRTRWATKQIAVDPHNPEIVYAGTRFDGLWKNEKGAEEGGWRYVSGIPHGVDKSDCKDSAGVAGIVFDENSEVINGKTSVIYVSVAGYGVYKSTDCGETFSLMPQSPKIGAQCMLMINGHIYVAGAAGGLSAAVREKYGIVPGIYKYDGKTWENITPTPSAPDYNSIAVNPDNENQMFAFKEGWTSASSAAMNCRTMNGGKTWEKITQIEDYKCIGTALFGKDTKDGGNAVYIPWGFGIYKMTGLDGKIDDLKLEEISKGVDLLCVFGMCSVPSFAAPKLLIACADFGQRAVKDFYGGSYKTTSKQENSLGLAYCASDPSIVMTAGSRYQKSGAGYVELSTDYGNTYTLSEGWQAANTPTSAAISAVKQKNGYPILMIYSNSGKPGVYRSLDFGKTWELSLSDDKKILEDANGKSLNADWVDGNKFYMMLKDGSFYMTSDGGDSWQHTSTIRENLPWPQVTKSVPNMEGHVWTSAKNNGLYTTADSGYTWTKLLGVDKCYGFGFGKNKDGVREPSIYLYGVCGGKEGIFRSDDYAKTWTEIGNPGQNPGFVTSIEGDANVYGRVYIGTKSVLCGQIAGTGTDDGNPVITLDNQSSAEKLDKTVNKKEYTVSGRVSKAAEVRINNIPVQLNGNNEFEHTVILNEGKNTVRAEAVDSEGNKAEVKYIEVCYDPSYMGLFVNDELYTSTNRKSYTINGTVSDAGYVKCNDRITEIGESKKFTMELPLEEYENKFSFSAYDLNGHKSEEILLTVIHDNISPSVELENAVNETESGILSLKGRLSEDGEVKINGKLVELDNNSFWNPIQLADGKNIVYIQARDRLKNVMKPIELTVTKLPDKNENIDVKYADEEFMKNYKLDGNIGEWELPYTMNKILGTPTNYARFGLRWDETYLYAAIDVEDDILSDSASAVYRNDTVEIYLDGNNSKSAPYDEFDKQYMYQWGRKNTGTTEYEFAKTENGYSMEMKIPWANINTSAAAESLIGFDIDVCDNDGTDGTRKGVIIFKGDENNFKDTSKFATLRLVK